MTTYKGIVTSAILTLLPIVTGGCSSWSAEDWATFNATLANAHANQAQRVEVTITPSPYYSPYFPYVPYTPTYNNYTKRY